MGVYRGLSAGVVSSRGAQPLALGGLTGHAGQPVEGAGQIMHAQLGVDFQRRFRVAVSGELLTDLDRCAAFDQQRDIRRPQSMKIDHLPGAISHR